MAQDKVCNEEINGMALRDIEGINTFKTALQVIIAEDRLPQALILSSVVFCPSPYMAGMGTEYSFNKIMKMATHSPSLFRTHAPFF